MINTPHIMIIDDDITLLRSVEHVLLGAGYTVSLAKSGRQALKLLGNGNIPELILLDIAMPEMDGYTTFKEIQAIHNIPIIFLTSMEDMQAELTGLKLGAIDYITKPFVMDILLARINNHLQNNRLRNQAPVHVEVMGETSELAVQLDKDKCQHMKTILTESEYRVGKRIALGYTNQEIADELNFSYSYVKKIATRIFVKLDISKRHEIRVFFTN